MVADGLPSAHSKRAYGRALADFLHWYAQYATGRLDKATVQRYAAELAAGGMSPANLNLRLSAIRKLAVEAADNGLLPPEIAAGIQRVKGLRAEGRRTGNWLYKSQAQALLEVPDITTLKGLRDRALLALLLSTGLRRSEAASLELRQIQQRDARWVIVDLIGKGNKIRTVPMPSWCKAAIDAWTTAAGITTGAVLRPVNKGDRLADTSPPANQGAKGGRRDGMTPQAIYNTWREYTGALGLAEMAVHDARRTFAKLAHKGGAALEQIQLSLGHASLTTTERYLGIEQDLTDAPCDHLGLRLD
jgi:site-specific recombinase XerD